MPSVFNTPVGGKRLPMQPLLPVDPHWKCQRDGACCTQPAEVVMTKEEAAALTHAAPSTIALTFRPLDNGFVALKTGPCPLYAFNSCLAYEARPYNCRRFACMRPDPKSEPYDVNGGNLFTRLEQSRPARRLYARLQNRAMVWARNHGWKEGA